MNSENLHFSLPGITHFNKEIVIPPSKSHSNRALILGALLGKNFKIYNISRSTDVLNLLDSLKTIGLNVEEEAGALIFRNSFPECEKEAMEDVIKLRTGDGGTTNRFLMALLSRGKKEYHLYPTEKMSERPMDDLISPLREMRVQVAYSADAKNETPWIKLKGPAIFKDNHELEINCTKSTQFASALRLAFFNTSLDVKCVNVHASETYLQMTSLVIKKSLEKNNYYVPIDFSSLSYPAALAAVLGRLVIKNCQEVDAVQPDSVFLEVLKEIGTQVNLHKDGLDIRRQGPLKPFSFDLNKALDLFPTLVFLASHIEGQSSLVNLELLKYKESDRLQEMLSLLKIFEIEHTFDETSSVLKIAGKNFSNKKKIEVHPARDHRIVMAAALFMATAGGGDLFEIDCVKKSYPHFFDLFLNLGLS